MSQYDPRAWGAKCDVCPLNGNRVVPPSGPMDAPLVLVGEAPGYWEIKKNGPFVGPSGVKLDDLMYGVKQDVDKQLYSDMKRDRLFVTNALLCRPENKGANAKKRYDVKEYIATLRRNNAMLKKMKAQLVESPFECCRPRLEKELEILEANARANGAPNGVVVMPLGNFALEQLTRTEAKKGKAGIMKYRGSVIVKGENHAEKTVQGAAGAAGTVNRDQPVRQGGGEG